ncbi:hypothetical protein ACNOYE_33010 [Nannocystaceae bacterium ST9]
MTTDLSSLRRRLSSLVYRDTAQAYQRGVALVVMALVYMFTAWRPDQIRAAILAAEPASAAAILAAVMVVHHLASAGLVERMLASDRLTWWWQLPVPRTWWRALHWRHLIALHLGWLAATIYGLWPVAITDPWRAAALAIAWIGVSLAAAVARVILRDRGPLVRVAIVVIAAASVVITELVAAELGALIGVVALAWTHRSLDRPMPELALRPTWRWDRTHPVLALARLRVLVVARRDRPALAGLLALELALAYLTIAAFGQIGEAAGNFARGAAVVASSLGGVLLVRSQRLLAGELALMDGWGIDPRHERRARLLAALSFALPYTLIAGARLPILWTLEALPALAWAGVGALRASLVQRDTPALGRFFARTIAAVMLVVILGSTLPLLAWIAFDAIGLARDHARAEALRRRVHADLATRDDHGI